MPCVTRGTSSDRAVSVRLANAVALFTPTCHGRSTFELHKRMRWTPCAARLVGFRKVHLLGSQSFVAIYGSPGRRCMPAAQKLLIDAFVTASAIACSQLCGNDEPVVVLFLLAAGRLVA